MAAKKSAPKKAKKKTLMQKIGEQASHLKEELVAGKDHLVDIAGVAVESIKSSIQNITHKKKAAVKKSAKAKPKKVALKKSVKKAAKKVAVKKVAKKVAAPKKSAKK